MIRYYFIEDITKKETTYRIFWNGRVRVKTNYSVIWLGEEPINRFHPGVWSPDGDSLNVSSFITSDKQGSLSVNLDSSADSSNYYTIFYRKPQNYGDLSEFTIDYICENNFQDILQECSDDFLIGLPTRAIGLKST